MMEQAIQVIPEANDRAANRLGADNPSGVFERIRTAFELFDNQSTVLQMSFDNLRKNLAKANRELNIKNTILGEKVHELHQMSSWLTCVLASIGDGVIVVNRDLVIEHCNAAARDIIGLNEKDPVGLHYHAVMNGLGNQGALLAAIMEGHVRIHENRQRKRENAGLLHVLASVSPVQMSDGRITGAVEVLQDVTGLRMLEERMQHQKRMVALGEMAAGVAHEIRNPLGTIEGFARLLRQDLNRDGLAAHSQLASKIIEGAQNLNYVITSLMTYVRPMALQCESFEIATLLRSTEELLQGLARQHDTTLVVTHGAGVVHRADIRQIRQVLVNLGRNAIEACKPGKGRVEMFATTDRNRVVFTVTDNGCGISAEDMPKVFDPFFTLKDGGTGLGLALSHRIVTAHGGEITLRSEPGRGTTARVALDNCGEYP